jgi:hypothetical protein
MRAIVNLTIITAVLLVFAHQSLSQIGETKDELIRRYGKCQPNPAGKPKGPNVYDSVIDVGEDCTFQHGQLTITSMFRAGRAVAFYYRKERTFWDSLMHGKSDPYWELSSDEISDILRTAMPGAESWIVVSNDTPIHQWRTSDSSAFAYYFASGHHDLYWVLVQTPAVDAMYKKTDKYIRGLRPN